MPLSDRAKRELAGERDVLIQQRSEIEERLTAIQLLIGDDAPAPAVRRRRKARRGDRPRAGYHRTPHTSNTTATNVAEKTANGIGLREAIRRATNTSGFNKPREVINSLKAMHFEIKGKTPLETRVYNELKRMYRDGLMDREGGRYKLRAA